MDNLELLALIIELMAKYEIKERAPVKETRSVKRKRANAIDLTEERLC